jgi:hypothetical protein
MLETSDILFLFFKASPSKMRQTSQKEAVLILRFTSNIEQLLLSSETDLAESWFNR